MINLRVLVPEATTNYITNPSFRYGTDGWNTQGATISRSLDFARFGISSGKVVTSGSAPHEGVYFRVSALAGISEPITESIYLRGTGKVRLRLDNNVVGGGEVSTETIELNPNRWERYDITGFSTGGNDMRLWVESDDTVGGITTPRAYTFYIDGAQMERKPYATSYCDGDQPGCRWNIVSNGSISTRTADTRKGGRWVSLAGPCRPDNDIYVTLMGGFGMPPVQNQTQSWAQEAGSYYQNQKILDRVVTMNFTVKDEDLRAVPPAQLQALHNLRQQLVDLFKSDVTLNDESFLFEYYETEATRPLYIEFRYDAGLEGSWDIRNGWYNNFILRLIAVDPLFSEDNQDVKQLNTEVTYNSTTPMEIWAKINGDWNKVQNEAGITLQNSVICSAVSPDGTVYLGGQFTNNGYNYIVRWDGKNFTVLGTGGANNIVWSLAVGPDGTLYAGGNFTNIGGVAANRIAKYNPSTNTWTAMSTGADDIVYALCVAHNGQVYIGGLFTTLGGTTCSRIGRWDGSQFRTVGANSGFSSTSEVRTIVKGSIPGIIYAGGNLRFNRISTVAYRNVVSIDTSTNLISAMGVGLGTSNQSVLSMAVGKDGTIYAGGNFALAGNLTTTILGVGQYQGGQWSQVGSGLNGVFNSHAIRTLAIGNNGELYAGGTFSFSGTKSIPKIARYFGGTWSPLEFYTLSSSSGLTIQTILYCPNGDIFVGQDTSSGSPYVSQVPNINTVVNNGSASCWPLLYLYGQGTLIYVANIKTNQEIFLNLQVFFGEDVTIDFALGKITSSVRGDLSFAILPGSEIRSINLKPGDNSIAVLMVDEVTPLCQLRWEPKHWSADAVVDAEAMV